MALPCCCFIPHYLVSNLSRTYIYNICVVYYDQPELYGIPLTGSKERNTKARDLKGEGGRDVSDLHPKVFGPLIKAPT